MTTKIFPSILFLFFFMGCRVTFVPNYDPTIEQQIVNTAKANDKIYLQLLAAPEDKRAYTNYAQTYTDVAAEINSIQLKEKARKNNDDMIKIAALIQKHFEEYQTEHKSAQTALNDAKIKIYEHQMQAFWQALLLAEKGLPHVTPND